MSSVKGLAHHELAPVPHATQTKPHFYRPELDALRFFAFLAVFFHHSPGIYPAAHAALWKITAARAFMMTRAAGGFGMSLFFVLSSYLITELLLREKRAVGDVHLRAFYARRILRIWPLYFLATGLGIILGKLIPNYAMHWHAILAFLAFAVAWIPNASRSLFTVLWSIGVEEQFYLVWPVLAKAGGSRTIMWASFMVMALSFAAMAVFASSGGRLWYNPLVEFLFFAVGALLSIALHGRAWDIRSFARWLLLGAGIFIWILAEHLGHISNPPSPPPVWRDCLGYSLSAVGCLCIFMAFLGIPAKLFPVRALYLGKISYGLYVFHAAILILAMRWLPPSGNSYSLARILTIDAVSLCSTILIAACSYRYFEMPFLRLKRRFEFVYSRA